MFSSIFIGFVNSLDNLILSLLIVNDYWLGKHDTQLEKIRYRIPEFYVIQICKHGRSVVIG